MKREKLSSKNLKIAKVKKISKKKLRKICNRHRNQRQSNPLRVEYKITPNEIGERAGETKNLLFFLRNAYICFTFNAPTYVLHSTRSPRPQPTNPKPLS
jgi:hypothetical protein